MYRQPYCGSFRYVCGLYQQSHAQECSHNHVDGPQATRVVLAALEQRLLPPDRLDRLKEKIRQRAREEVPNEVTGAVLKTRERELVQVQAELVIVQRNMAMAANQDHFRSISAVFDELRIREASIKNELIFVESQRQSGMTVEQEVEAVMAEMSCLTLDCPHTVSRQVDTSRG